MKKLLSAITIAVASMGAHADFEQPQALNAADGIFQQVGRPDIFWIVVSAAGSNGVAFIPLANIANINRSVSVVQQNGQIFRPAYVDYGDIFVGNASGSVALVSGMFGFRACTGTYQTFLSGTAQITVTTLAIGQTADGAAQGIDCNSLAAASGGQLGATRTFIKTF